VAVRLDGVIDEHNGLDAVAQQLDARGPLLIVVLGGVQRINSVGVRDWVTWLRTLQERFDAVALVDCPPAVMNEVNLVRNFARGAILTTFRAPYYCDRCGRESVEPLDALAMVASGARAAPSAPCGKPACANALDDANENYFAFLDDLATVTLPPNLEASIAAARRALDEAPSELPAPAPALRAPLTTAPPRPTPSPVPAAPEHGRRDLPFILVLVAMIGVLSTLIYLITTLE